MYFLNHELYEWLKILAYKIENMMVVYNSHSAARAQDMHVTCTHSAPVSHGVTWCGQVWCYKKRWWFLYCSKKNGVSFNTLLKGIQYIRWWNHFSQVVKYLTKITSVVHHYHDLSTMDAATSYRQTLTAKWAWADWWSDRISTFEGIIDDCFFLHWY